MSRVPRRWMLSAAAVALCVVSADSLHPAAAQTAVAPVLIVCEHGSVKSLMAASIFNQTAAVRGLPFRAISRGVTPDESVPPKIAAALTREGFDVKGFVPQRVSSEDVSKAMRVVAIGVDLSPFAQGTSPPMDHWDDVPAASVDYAAARESLKKHVDRLLAELQAVH